MNDTLKFITYTYHEDTDIHEILLHNNNRQTVDELLQIITTHMNPEEQTDETRLLLDQREAGVLPIRYLTSKMREYRGNQKHTYGSRTVILYKDNALLTLMQGAMKLFSMKGSETFTFIKDDYDEAIAWLLQNELEVTE